MRVRSFIFASVVAALTFMSPGALGAGVVEPRVVPGAFPTNPSVVAMGGGIMPELSGKTVVNGNEVSGLVTFDLIWHFAYTWDVVNTVDTSLSIIYTVDDLPVSPVLPSPYTFVWDSSTVPDGAHVFGVILVDGANDATRYVPNSTVATVDNVPGPVLGPQKIPSLGPGVIRISHRSSRPELVQWNTGYVWPHPTSTVPYPAPVPAPARTRGLSDAALLALPFVSEPITQSNVTMEATGLQVVRSATGHLFVEINSPEVASNADDSLAGVLARPMIDGPRNDNGVSPYSSYEAHPTARAFRGIDLAGRLFQVNFDGSVKTLAGRQIKRDVVPYSVFDPRVTEKDRRALQVTVVGNFNGVEWNQPNGFATDPRNENIIYVADTENHRVSKTVLSANPETTTCAGDPNVKGDVDGLTAQLTGPSGVAVAPDGTVYVADYDLGKIKKIAPDCGAVSTVASGLAQPFAIQFDSHGALIVLELTNGALKRLDLGSGAVTLIYGGIGNAGWTWFAVDWTGSIGPIDDMLVTTGTGGDNHTITRISADGLRVGPAGFPGDHYPWAIAIARNEARVISHGFGDTAPHFYRLSAPGDVDTGGFAYLNTDLWPIANRLQTWFDVWGQLPEFPFSAVSSQAALRQNGYSPFPGVTSYDDLARLPPDQIKTFIQSGLGGGYPRNFITGRDLDLAVESIQVNSAWFPNQVFPHLPPPPADATPPVISNVQISLIDPTTAQVTWETDEPSLGHVRFGSTPVYFRGSDLEQSFTLTHRAVLHLLPENKLVHLAIVVEDQASNFTMTPDKTVMTGSLGTGPSGPSPTATLLPSSMSIVLGQSLTLSWNSTNATSCLGVGFTAGPTSGVVVLIPTATATYSLRCSGPGGTSPTTGVSVTVIPPPPLPTASLTASLASITVGQGVMLSWSSTGATDCAGVGFKAGLTSGSIILSPLTTVTYSMSCTGPGGTSSLKSVTVVVTPPVTPVFKVGAKVKATTIINVHSSSNLNSKTACVQRTGALGTITDGPSRSSGLTWWRVDFATGCDGWVLQSYLALTP